MVTADVMKEGTMKQQEKEAMQEGKQEKQEEQERRNKASSGSAMPHACGIVLTRSKRPRKSATMLSNLFPILICMKRILLVLSVISM